MKTVLPIAVSIVLAALRAGGVKHEAFQAVAHLWAGGLIGAALAGRSWSYFILALVLSLFELACFFLV